MSRSFKQRCLRDVLDRYRMFLNLPNYPNDAKLAFFLTVCRMIDLNATHDIDFQAIASNEARLFGRYRFDRQSDERENQNLFVDRLLDPPSDSTVRFL